MDRKKRSVKFVFKILLENSRVQVWKYRLLGTEVETSRICNAFPRKNVLLDVMK